MFLTSSFLRFKKHLKKTIFVSTFDLFNWKKMSYSWIVPWCNFYVLIELGISRSAILSEEDTELKDNIIVLITDLVVGCIWLIFHERCQMSDLLCFVFLGSFAPARMWFFHMPCHFFHGVSAWGKATRHTVLVTLKDWNRQFSPSFSTFSEFISNICDLSNSSFSCLSCFFLPSSSAQHVCCWNKI